MNSAAQRASDWPLLPFWTMDRATQNNRKPNSQDIVPELVDDAKEITLVVTIRGHFFLQHCLYKACAFLASCLQVGHIKSESSQPSAQQIWR